MNKRTRFTLLFVAWLALLLTSVSLLRGQAVSFLGSPVNFGDVSVCASGKTPPTSCSRALTLVYKVTEGGTLAKPKVLTMGAPYLDFTLLRSSCTGTVTTGSRCSVEVALAPKFPGLRAGAVEIVDESGRKLATTLIRGVGQGPQMAVEGAGVTTLRNDSTKSGVQLIDYVGIAVDGAENVFLARSQNPGVDAGVFMMPAGGGPLTPVGSGFGGPTGLAMDGAGNLYVSDGGPRAGTQKIVKVPPGCQSTACEVVLDPGSQVSPAGIAVDGEGNIYLIDQQKRRVLKLPAGCASGACALPVGSGFIDPVGIAVDSAGSVFITDINFQDQSELDSSDRVVKIDADSGGQTTLLDTVKIVGIAVDAADDMILSDLSTGALEASFIGLGGTIKLATPGGYSVLALDSAGNVFFGDGPLVGEINRGKVPTYTFATANVGVESSDSPYALTLQNSGNAPLSLTGLTLGSYKTYRGFNRINGYGMCSAGLSLDPGSTCDLDITFTPITSGPVSGAAVLTDDALNAVGAQQIIPLVGIGK